MRRSMIRSFCFVISVLALVALVDGMKYLPRTASHVVSAAPGLSPQDGQRPTANFDMGKPQSKVVEQPNPLISVLYDQTSTPSTIATGSQNFEPAFDTFDDQTADDFVVPGGQSWSIQQVNVGGVYFNGPGPASSVNVVFYADSATLPGSAECTYTNLPMSDSAGNFNITLPVACVLTSGTHWVSVQANQNFTPNGQWGWTDRITQSNSGAAWRNPGGGFPGGCTSYGRRATCVGDPSAPDQIFQLLGDVVSGGCNPAWQVVAPMPQDLYGAAVTSNGTSAFAAGGYSFSTGTTLNVFRRYDPVANTWTTLAPMPGAAIEASAVYAPNTGKIYVFGGEDATSGVNSNATRIYDIGANTWSAGANMPDVRSFMAAGFFNNKIYLVSGYNTGQVTSAQPTVWDYDPVANTFNTVHTPIPHPTGGAAFGVINGHLYVAGGRDAANLVINLNQDYNIAADTWTPRANMPSATNVPGSAAQGGKLWVFGSGNPFGPINEFSAEPVPDTAATGVTYDPVADSWSAGPNLNVARSFVGGTAIGNKLLAAGGFNGSTTTQATELLDLGCGPSLAPAGSTLVNESCPPSNGAVDPGETATMTLRIVNNGTSATSNLVATLQPSANVLAPSGPQSYGAIAPTQTVGRDFTFTANGNCGDTITLTLQLQDGVNNLGTITYSVPLGQQVTSTIFSENFDGVVAPALPAGWTTAATGVESPWVTSTTTPFSAPNDAFAPDPNNIGNTELITPVIAVPAAGARLTFKNNYITESTFDGMVLEISINGGAYADITAGGNAFIAGGYNATISTSFGSPIAGRQAWSGTSAGYIDSTINLPPAANGQNVQLKWRMASDNSVAATGVRIDNIVISSTILVCNTACAGAPRISVSSVLSCSGSNKVATITLCNSGTATANSVVLTTAALGGVSGTPLPQSVGTLAPGACATRTVTFTGAPSGSTTLLTGGTYTGGSFSSSRKVTAPVCP